jgi:magnesium transporter
MTVVACAGYENGQRVAELAIDACASFIGPPGRFVWVGLHEPGAEVLQSLQQQFGLHELAVEDAFRAHQRPKVDVYGESLFLVLRTAQFVDGEIQFGETHIFAGKGYVISVRHGASFPYTSVRERCESMPKLLVNGEDFVLYAIMDFVVDNYIPIVDAIEDQVDEIDETAHAGPLAEAAIERISTLRRDLIRLRRTTAPMLDVCSRLQRFEVPFIDAEMRPYYSDVYDHVVHVNESIDILREMLASAFETHLLLASNRQNEVARKLAGWAAIFAVPTAIAGIYGMNFEHMPELKQAWGYPAVLLVITAVCVGLYVKFKRTGWL